MRTNTEALKNYLDSDGRQIKVKISYPGGDEITSVQSLDYDCSFGNSLALGNTISANIKVTCETPAFSITEREFTLYFGVDLPNTDDTTWTKIGVFKTILKSVESRMGFTTFTAYDSMYTKTNKEYTSSITYPASLSEILDDVCGQAGFSPVPAITANPTVEADVFSEYTIRDVIGFIAGYQSKNAYVDCDGNLIFKWFTSCDYTADGKKANVPYADEKDTTIKLLVCSTGDDNIQVGSGSASTELLSFNNPLMTTDRLEEILTEIKGSQGEFKYRRLDADIPLGNYLIESGDIIKVKYENEAFNFDYTVPAMSVSYHYDGGLSCKISSYGVPDGVMKSISAKKFRDHTKLNGLQKEIVHATEAITGADGGYVRINFGDDGKTAEILIMSSQDIEDPDLHLWRWNQGGLGYSSTGYNGSYDTAITNDGHIVADRISGNQISGVAIQTISDNSYLRMDQAHLTYYAHAQNGELGDKIAGIYAMNDGRDGMMISCLDNCWISLGVDVGSGSLQYFAFRPYDNYATFWLGGSTQVEGQLFCKAYQEGDPAAPSGMWDVAGGINALNKRVDDLETAVAGMFTIITEEEK